MDTPTISYGSWRVGSCVTVEDTVAEYLGEFAHEYNVLAVARAYREAIDEALPEGVSLNGDEFFGPYYDRPEVDISAVVESVDLGEIAQRHERNA